MKKEKRLQLNFTGVAKEEEQLGRQEKGEL